MVFYLVKKKHYKGKVVFLTILLLLLAQPILNIEAVNSFALSKGKWFKWKGELEITGTKVWDITEELRIVESSSSGNSVSGKAEVIHRILEIKVGGEKSVVVDNNTVISFNFDLGTKIKEDLFDPIYPVSGLNKLPFTVFTIFNTKRINDVKTYVYSGLTEVPGILKDTWDIVLGTWRSVIYVELYTAKKEYVEAAILEFLVTIDKELGIVLNIWSSWYFYGTRFILRLKLADTNAFAKNLLYFTVIGIIIGIIALVIIVRKVVLKKR